MYSKQFQVFDDFVKEKEKEKQKENIPPLTFQSYNIVIIRRLDLVTKLSARANVFTIKKNLNFEKKKLFYP